MDPVHHTPNAPGLRYVVREGAKALLAAVRRPRDVSRYLRDSVIQRGTLPVELGLPWFSYGAIDFLDRWLTNEMTVYEFGAGGSTIFFAQRVANVVSVEDDSAWHARVVDELAARRLTNARVICASLEPPAGESIDRSPYALAVPASPAEVLVVDCQDQETWMTDPVRPKFFAIAKRLVAPGGIIVLDDAWRYPQLRSSGSRVKRFVGLGPARLERTETDVFFY